MIRCGGSQRIEVLVGRRNRLIHLAERLGPALVEFLRLGFERGHRTGRQIAAKKRDLIVEIGPHLLERLASLAKRRQNSGIPLLALIEPLLPLLAQVCVLNPLDGGCAPCEVRVPRRLHLRDPFPCVVNSLAGVLRAVQQLLEITFHVFRRLRYQYVVRRKGVLDL